METRSWGKQRTKIVIQPFQKLECILLIQFILHIIAKCTSYKHDALKVSITLGVGATVLRMLELTR